MDIFNRYPIIVLKKLNIKMTNGYVSLSKDGNTSNSENGEKFTIKNKNDLVPGELPKASMNNLRNRVKIKKVKSEPAKWFCAKCSKEIKRSHYSIKCNKCNDWLHLRCSNLDSIAEWHDAWSGSCCGVESDAPRKDPSFLDFPQHSKALSLQSACCKILSEKNSGVTRDLDSFCPKYLQEKTGENFNDATIKCEKNEMIGDNAESLANNLSSYCDTQSKSIELTTEFPNVSLESKTIYDKKPARRPKNSTSNSERPTNSKSCRYCVTKVPVKSERTKWYCADCSLQIKKSHYSVRCNKCNDWLHLRCSNLGSIEKWHDAWSGSCCGVESDAPREDLFSLDSLQHNKVPCLSSAGCEISPIKEQGFTRELVSFGTEKLSENVYDDKPLSTAIKCEKKERIGDNAESLTNNLSSFCDIESNSKVPMKSDPAASDSDMLASLDLHVKSYLKQHVLSHFEERPFACRHCPMTFKHKAILSQHVKTHTVDKLYQCTLCPEKFCQPHHLKSHILLHTNAPFVCPNCSTKFRQKESLWLHIGLKHSTNQPNPCALRPANFMRKSYENHMIRHNSQRLTWAHLSAKFISRSGSLGHKSRSHLYEKLYTCEHCNKKFGGKTNMRSHIKAVHLKPNAP